MEVISLMIFLAAWYPGAAFEKGRKGRRRRRKKKRRRRKRTKSEGK